MLKKFNFFTYMTYVERPNSILGKSTDTKPKTSGWESRLSLLLVKLYDLG